MTPEWWDRLMPRVDITPTCWLWTGGRNGDGYGHIQINRRKHKVHRLVYEHLVGPIPDGLQIDHLCRVRHCVNPDHLEPVTSRENTLRGSGLAAQQVRRTHCPKGHPYSGENLIVKKDGLRRCRTCNKSYGKRKAAA